MTDANEYHPRENPQHLLTMRQYERRMVESARHTAVLRIDGMGAMEWAAVTSIFTTLSGVIYYNISQRAKNNDPLGLADTVASYSSSSARDPLDMLATAARRPREAVEVLQQRRVQEAREAKRRLVVKRRRRTVPLAIVSLALLAFVDWCGHKRFVGPAAGLMDCAAAHVRRFVFRQVDSHGVLHVDNHTTQPNNTHSY